MTVAILFAIWHCLKSYTALLKPLFVFGEVIRPGNNPVTHYGIHIHDLQYVSLLPLVDVLWLFWLNAGEEWLSSYHRCTATSTLLLVWTTWGKPAMPSWYFGELQIFISPTVMSTDKSWISNGIKAVHRNVKNIKQADFRRCYVLKF